MDVGTRGRRLESLHHMRRRPDLGVAATEVDERLALLRGCHRDTSEQRREVLLGQPLDPLRSRPHRPIVVRRGLPKTGRGKRLKGDGVLQALRGERRGALSLLPVVRRAATAEARRVLQSASTRSRQGAAGVAVPGRRPAGSLQRLGRPGPRRGGGLGLRDRGGTALTLPSSVSRSSFSRVGRSVQTACGRSPHA